ncbi:hypothetical protein [Actinophytocola sp.]|uniref:hypothetical protein n=1 Tax=Actinophytocola sp. TaxID=1872138 RepID=UPI00389A0638
MGIWGISILVLALALVVTLVAMRGGKEGRAVRRELRQLRAKDGRGPDTFGAAELRRGMYMSHVPGKDTLPGGS